MSRGSGDEQDPHDVAIHDGNLVTLEIDRESKHVAVMGDAGGDIRERQFGHDLFEHGLHASIDVAHAR